ncbi:hypothetical protein ABZ714_33925 [Streptomyces sp. NPDC006798]|uniref:hypothetical protein n=1 Tax=Streptomyces sp. NPDC006798 TaxID=3155462 RepID=UPI0033C36C7F
MSTQEFDGSYLLPLFAQADRLRGNGVYRPLPTPASSSSLATDDKPLGPWRAAHLIQVSYGAGLAHLDAFRRLTLAGEIDPTSPWTLMRGALENFATGIWLLHGKDRAERRHRALSLWHEDMRNRAQHEDDTGHQPAPGGKTGTERRREIADLAHSLGLPNLTAPRTTVLLEQAAPAAGLDPVSTRAAWRAASGYAHGRYWPNIRTAQPRAAYESGTDSYMLAMVIDEAQHRPLTEYCGTMLRHLHARYHSRSIPS